MVVKPLPLDGFDSIILSKGKILQRRNKEEMGLNQTPLLYSDEILSIYICSIKT